MHIHCRQQSRNVHQWIPTEPVQLMHSCKSSLKAVYCSYTSPFSYLQTEQLGGFTILPSRVMHPHQPRCCLMVSLQLPGYVAYADWCICQSCLLSSPRRVGAITGPSSLLQCRSTKNPHTGFCAKWQLTPCLSLPLVVIFFPFPLQAVFNGDTFTD